MTTNRLAAIRNRHSGTHYCNLSDLHEDLRVALDAAAGVTVAACERPHRRIAHLPPGIPTCPICLYRNPGAEPGDTRPIGDHDCKWEDAE